MRRGSRLATRRWHASTSRATSSTRSGTTPLLHARHNTRHEALICACVLSSLTTCKALFISHETVRNLMQGCPRISDAFWRDTLIDAAVFREWILNVGRREAYGRMAHLLCEFYVRLKAVGLTNGDACDMPFTQAELADAT